MNRLKDTALVVLALLCILLALSHVVTPTPLRAQTADSNSSMIAVTGNYASGSSVLYVIDTNSRNLAVYETRNGRDLTLVAARKIEYDLKLERYHDKSPDALQVPALRKDWQRVDEILKKAADDEAAAKPEKPEKK
ncbi:MAG: hypothetical protein HYR85_21125 [Planctomycetes bacterium]|nr:hypothetical protein [Planctomycetota bacterium]MBI3844604.1 hypothetical protein [Planctomycetota bacterium]